MPNYLHFNLGTRRGLVVTKPGSQARVRRFAFPLATPTFLLEIFFFKSQIRLMINDIT